MIELRRDDRSDYDSDMDVIRRAAWVLAFVAALPGVTLGIMYLYAFFVWPIVFLIGHASAYSRFGQRIALGLFMALVVAFAVGFGMALRHQDWWLFLLIGGSCLLALLTAYKTGMVVRLRSEPHPEPPDLPQLRSLP
jgi:hypothetical protein